MPSASKKPTCRKTLFSVYGLLLDQILDTMSVPKPRGKAKKQLHTAFKDAHGIETLTKLENASISAYIDSIFRYFAIEHGIYLRKTNEPEGVQDMTLSQYHGHMQRNEAKHQVFDKLESLYNFHSHSERKRFLCDITDTPPTSAAGDDERILEGVREWISSN